MSPPPCVECQHSRLTMHAFGLARLISRNCNKQRINELLLQSVQKYEGPYVLKRKKYEITVENKKRQMDNVNLIPSLDVILKWLIFYKKI